MMTTLKWILVGLLAIILLVGMAIASPFGSSDRSGLRISALAETATVEELDAWVEQLHAEARFNGVVSVRISGVTVYRRAIGSWDETGQRALTPSTPLRLASLSKPYTATAVLKLVESGEVALDVPVSHYLPECAFDGVTARNLLNHSSGVPDRYMELEDDGDLVTISSAMSYICSGELEETPGSTYRYNNSGYVLLAALVERVTGESFEAAMDQRVFEPLGLAETRIWNLVSGEGGLDVAPTFQQGQTPPSREVPTLLDGVAGDGAVHSSLNDLEAFALAWSEGRVLPPTLTREILTRTGPGDHALGWIVQDNGAIWHNGSWLGASTMMAINPERGDWLILAGNGGGHATGDMAAEIAVWIRTRHDGERAD